jgi:hypothetical protein
MYLPSNLGNELSAHIFSTLLRKTSILLKLPKNKELKSFLENI